MRIIAGSRKRGVPPSARRARLADWGPRSRGGVHPIRTLWRTWPCSTCLPARGRWGSRRSRAARSSAVFVECDRDAQRTIERNLEKLGLKGARIEEMRAAPWRPRPPRAGATISSLPTRLTGCSTPSFQLCPRTYRSPRRGRDRRRRVPGPRAARARAHRAYEPGVRLRPADRLRGHEPALPSAPAAMTPSPSATSTSSSAPP